MKKANRTEEFGAVFDIVERMHSLLEGIQNVAGNSGVEPEQFVEYVKPESDRWWRQLNDFWESKIPYVGATIDDA